MENSAATLVEIGPSGEKVREPLIFNVYVRNREGFLDVCRSGAIPDHDGSLVSRDRRGEEGTPRSGAWMNRWNHCAVPGIVSLRTSSSLTYMLYVRLYE